MVTFANGRVSCVFVLSLVLGACSAQLGQESETDGDGTGTGEGDPHSTSDIDDPAWSEDPATDPFRPLVRRLTRDEVMFTTLDLLGVPLSADDMATIPEDRPLEGFGNIATSQTVLPEHVEGYAAVAETVAGVLDWNATVAAMGICQSGLEGCRDELVGQLGARLFRRPLEETEQTAFASLYDAVLAEEGVDAGLASDAVLRAMMQSPQFLYRLESETAVATGLSPGEERTIDGHEMATRLSYTVWASAPDQALLDAAAAGELGSPDGIAAQLDRMLADVDKARRVTDRYMKDWGRLEALPDDGGLRSELVESVVATYSTMIWDQIVPLTEVFTADQILLTETLAQNLGLTSAGPGLLAYDVSSMSGRVGLLTHPGLIAGMTNADGGAIVARGLFLQTQLFCQETPSPPIALDDAIDEFLGELPPDASDRLIAETRLERPECGSCHGGFDPLAYGLEQFDFQGRFRNADEHGNALTTDGWIPMRVRLEGDDLPYQTVEELAQILVTEPAVHHCATQQHLEQALGRNMTPELEPLVAQVFGEFSNQGGTYAAMLGAISAHDLFRKMKVE